MDLLARVRRFVREHDLMRSGTRVVAAVSGGSDSVALAYLLRELDASGELRLAGVAHVNHQLRPTAVRDEQVAIDVARALDRPIVSRTEDVAARARQERISIEVAARDVRYAALEHVRVELDSDVVATGHTRDDQAETFLLRLLRGAGSRGLAGIHPRRDRVVRPLLACRRAELRAWLDARGIGWVDDESNADVAIPRNRVRVELMPMLESRFNPSIVDVLADAAELARDEWEWMASSAGERFGVDRRGAETTLDLAALKAAPRALQRVVLWRAMSDAAAMRPVAFEHVAAALRLLDSPDASAGVDFPGHRLERAGSRVVLTSKGSNLENPFCYPLSVPGEVVLAEARCVVSAESADADAAAEAAKAAGRDCAIVRNDLCPGPLAVRSRRPGDRFRPVGLDGRKKLQDFFVDRKVARRDRDRVPIVVDAQDRIVWVAGHGIDARFRVTDPTQSVLILRLRQLGGPA